MKKGIRNAVFIILTLCLVFLYAHIAKCHNVYDPDIDASDHQSVSCYHSGPVAQRFISVEENLDAVRIKCRIVGNVEKVDVHFVLTETESGKEIASGTVSGKNFQNGKFAQFPFDRISGCKGKEYEILLDSKGETEENLINFCYQAGVEEDTAMYVDGVPKEGTLILKMVIQRFDLETFCVLLIFVAYIVVFMKFLYGLFR